MGVLKLLLIHLSASDAEQTVRDGRGDKTRRAPQPSRYIFKKKILYI